MKRFCHALIFLLFASSVVAVDISLVDNMDGTGTIQMTVTGMEVVRGLAIVVDAGEGEIVLVSAIDPIFNVFMDAAFTAEGTTPGSYNFGDGTPVANPAAAGEMALPASVISLCMGVLDGNGGQAGATAGVYNIGTIDLDADSTVTITADALRGGIVGDNITTENIGGGYIPPPCGDCGCVTCMYQSHSDYREWAILGCPASWCNPRQCYGDADAAQESYGKISSWVGLNDLAILIEGWRKLYLGGEVWIAADFSRRDEAYGKCRVRIGLVDLSILVANWRKDSNSMVVPTNCND